MSAIKIVDGVYWVGARDFNLRFFDIIMTAEQGTSYNAYVVKGSENSLSGYGKGEILIWMNTLQRLQEVVDITAIDYLIINHAEPDHTGSIEAFCCNPELTILAAARP